MIELKPEMIEGILVFNVHAKENCKKPCKLCVDYSVGIHNRLKKSELPYLIIDFQDAKDYCRTFLEEIVHLRKRIRMPMFLVGVMPRVETFFKEYSLLGQAKIFMDPESAIKDLKKTFPNLVGNNVKDAEFKQNIQVAKSKMPNTRVPSAPQQRPPIPDRVEL